MSPEALARLRKDLADQVAPSRDDLRALLDAYDTARAEGVAAERARVVAWLRETRDGSTDWQQESHDLLTLLAFQFERGEHDKEGER